MQICRNAYGHVCLESTVAAGRGGTLRSVELRGVLPMRPDLDSPACVVQLSTISTARWLGRAAREGMRVWFGQ